MVKHNKSWVETVRSVIQDKDKFTLKDVYDILSDHPDVTYTNPRKFKHRIRSTVYSMNKAGEIRRTAASTYQNMRFGKN